MTVRHFIEVDFQAVCHVYNDAKRDELQYECNDFEVTPLEQDSVILAAFRESEVLVFDDREVQGFAAFYGSQLRALFVRRDARGNGVGQALLNAVLATGRKEILLNVARSNAAARRFYGRNGFTDVGESVRTYKGIDIAYVTMMFAASVADTRR